MLITINNEEIIMSWNTYETNKGTQARRSTGTTKQRSTEINGYTVAKVISGLNMWDVLYNGIQIIRFDTKREAVHYAETH